MWCAPNKWETSCTSLFWDMGNLSYHRSEKMTHLSILRVFFLGTLKRFLLPPRSFWLIFKHFPTKKKNLHFLQPVISKTKGMENFKGWFLKITLPEKLLMVLYTNGHISKSSRKYELNFGIKLKLKACSLQWCQNCFFPKCHLFPGLWECITYKNFDSLWQDINVKILTTGNLYHWHLQVVNLFNLFITYGDTFLPTPSSYDELYYELIRMHQVFDNLYSMGKLAISSEIMT